MIEHPLGSLLSWIYDHLVGVPIIDTIGAYGVAIIAVTILIRLALAPLQQFQLVTQRRTVAEQRKLAPQVAQLKKKFGKDTQKLNAEMMKLYQEHGVNPLGGLVGCLPLIVQIPVLTALYWVFRNAHVGSPHFLFVPNLMAFPTQVPILAGLPIPAVAYLIFPLLAALTTFVQSKMLQAPTPPNPTEQEQQTQQMQRMMVVMSPLMIGYFALQVPAGLGLYWFIGNCVSIIQQYFVVGWGSLRPKGGSSPVSQPKGAGPPKNGGGSGNAKQLPRRVQGGRARAKDAK
ncbi:MAG TPA: YidC/Oxa1 family membrane protein insertase, partial [Acidobacteriaceae bacterium]